MANVCVHSRFKERIPGLICKLYLEKAYDMVDWMFLLYMLGRMGFGEKWRKWILECLFGLDFYHDKWVSKRFHAQKGLRQGDPLSPFLFLLVAEALGRISKGAVRAGLVEGFRVARNP